MGFLLLFLVWGLDWPMACMLGLLRCFRKRACRKDAHHPCGGEHLMLSSITCRSEASTASAVSAVSTASAAVLAAVTCAAEHADMLPTPSESLRGIGASSFP